LLCGAVHAPHGFNILHKLALDGEFLGVVNGGLIATTP
jgi:hypothetical protein